MAPWARRWPVGDGQVRGSVRQLRQAAHASREVGAPEGPEVTALGPHLLPSGVAAPYPKTGWSATLYSAGGSDLSITGSAGIWEALRANAEPLGLGWASFST
jgi:hypothetical protein